MLTQKMTPSFDTVRPVLYPPYSDRAAWQSLPCAARWQAAGQAALQEAAALPALPLSLWLQFTQNGDRTRWEHAYFARRRTLCALTMAEAVTGDGSYLRDAPQLPTPNTARPVVDLFAAETGALLATVYGLLGTALDSYAPGLAERIRGEVECRILTPYLTSHFWWMGHGDEPMCNWTPWCTQNVLLAAVQCADDARLPDFVRQAAYSLDCFLQEYGDDGCCSEGAQYYRHAALTMFSALSLLCGIAPGVFDDVWQEQKIRNMAVYIVNMHVGGPYYFNFADCSPQAGARGVREYLFGKKVGSLPLMTLAARDWAAAVAAPDPDRLHHPDDSEGINLYYHIQTALAEKEVLAFAQNAAPVPPPDVWYPSVGILVSRRGALALGVKAGSNADSHNHNDVGSVTLYKNGLPLLIDVGVETYSKKTFSPQRYEIWTMQSSWHNLPEFDPDGAAYQQQAGAEFAAAAVTVADTLDDITMDIAPAYGNVPGLTTYRHTVTLTESALHLQDKTDYTGTVALTLMSVEKPVSDGRCVQFGTLAEAILDGASKILVEPVPITDARLRQAWPDTLYRTRVYFTGQLCLTVF